MSLKRPDPAVSEEEIIDDELKRLTNEIKIAKLALKGRMSMARNKQGNAKDWEQHLTECTWDDIIDVIRETEHKRNVTERKKRNLAYAKDTKLKTSDEEKYVWCENRLDSETFFILPKLRYYEWRDMQTCPTWGELRSTLSLDFFYDIIVKRYRRIHGEDSSLPEGDCPFDTKDLRACPYMSNYDFFDEEFPPYIEQIMHDEFGGFHSKSY